MKIREFKDFSGRPSALIFDGVRPVVIANYWLSNYKPGLSAKSKVLLAYDLVITMLFVKSRGIDLLERFSNRTFLTSGEIVKLRSYLEQSKQTVEVRIGGVGVIQPVMACSSAYTRRCRVAKEFFDFAAELSGYTSSGEDDDLIKFQKTIGRLLKSRSTDDLPPLVEPLSEEEFMIMDAHLKAQLNNKKRDRFLIHRDLIVLHLLRELGVRNSELLGVRENGFIRTGRGYVVVEVKKNKDLRSDPRTSPATVKTLDRKLKISDNLWTLIERYLVERKKRVASSAHDFLIITRRGQPLSNDSIGKIFKGLSLAIGKHITPHTLRHSWASNFILTEFERASMLSGREKERAISSTLSTLRAHMGWSLKSSMPEHYARFAFQRIGNERIITEEEILNASILRGLDDGEC